MNFNMNDLIDFNCENQGIQSIVSCQSFLLTLKPFD